MKFLAIKIISLYQKIISPLRKPSCIFYPTCSEYAKQAFEKYGFWKGAKLSVKRVLRCHPWQENQVDLIP